MKTKYYYKITNGSGASWINETSEPYNFNTKWMPGYRELLYQDPKGRKIIFKPLTSDVHGYTNKNFKVEEITPEELFLILL